jgi:alanine dehydrogenase
MFPQTASYALSNFFAPLLIEIGNEGGVETLLKRDNGLRNGVYLYNGILTNKNIAEHFQLSYRDLDLLIAAIH